MATELAAAYLTLMPTLKGSAKEISKQLGGIDVSGAGEKTGRSFGSSVARTIGKYAGPAAAIGVIGTAMVKGFSRLNALDQANAKLTGLGHSAESVTAIMDSALESVKGTAFGMDAAATVAASMSAAGVKNGQDMTDTLKLVADAATIAGTDMTSMGSIFGKVAASNKAQLDVFNQLADAGVPALQMVAKELGVTTEEASKMASAGKIDFATFQAAMEEGLGGAAQSSGDTFTGAMANVFASLGRTGANFMSGFFPKLAPLFQALTNAMGPLEAAAGEIGQKVADVLVPAIEWLTALMNGEGGGTGGGIFEAWLAYAKPMADAWMQVGKALMPVVQELFAQLGPILQQLTPFLAQMGELLGGVLVQAMTALAPFIQTLLTTLMSLVSQVLPVLMPVLTALGELLGSVLAVIMPIIVQLFEALAPVVQVLGDLLAALLVPILQVLSPILQALTPVLSFLAELIGGALVKAVELLTPIIAGLAGVLGDILGPAITAVGDMLSGFIDFLVGVFTGDWEKAWSGIVKYFTSLWEGMTGVVKGVINGIISMINDAIGGINGIVGAVGGFFGVDVQVPSIPHLAQGATVKPRSGGTLAVLAEAGKAETVVDTGKMNALMDRVLSGSVGQPSRANGAPTVQVDVHPAQGMDEAAVGRIAGNQAATQVRKMGF